MLISYKRLKNYVPDLPEPSTLLEIFTFHICEVESIKKLSNEDSIFDLNILPNRAHDLLSHIGVARELASLLEIKFKDPISSYKIPEAKITDLKIKIETDKCRRYMGRIVRNVKVKPSLNWLKEYLESIEQKSITNLVDATNAVMFDRGNPIHIFDLDKVQGGIIIRQAKKGEKMITLDDKEVKLDTSNMVIADEKNILAIAGVKGGKVAEVDENTRNIIIEVANFNPVSVRKTSKEVNIFTDAVKRFENDLSPEVAFYAMEEISKSILETCPEAIFENIIDIYPSKQKTKKFSFSTKRVSKILGIIVSDIEIKNILKRYNFEYTENNNNFEISIPFLRLDLEIEEDMAEEIGRILGYDKIKPKIPKIDFIPKINDVFYKILWARNKLLQDGYSEVMTYVFRNKGEVEVLASASNKNFLRTNLTDGLKESLKLNQINMLLLGMNEIKIFEIGTIFLKNGEEIHVAYNDKKEIKEVSLEDFCKDIDISNSYNKLLPVFNFKLSAGYFVPWSVYPFISRDIAVWVPSSVESCKVYEVIKNNARELLIRDPELFDSFKKDNKKSYAFRLVFQANDRTLTDAEINEIMAKISNKINENPSWQIR